MKFVSTSLNPNNKPLISEGDLKFSTREQYQCLLFIASSHSIKMTKGKYGNTDYIIAECIWDEITQFEEISYEHYKKKNGKIVEGSIEKKTVLEPNQLPRNWRKYNPLEVGDKILNDCKKIDIKSNDEIIDFCNKYGCFGKQPWPYPDDENQECELIPLSDFKAKMNDIKYALKYIKYGDYDSACSTMTLLIGNLRVSIEGSSDGVFKLIYLPSTLEQAIGVYLYQHRLRMKKCANDTCDEIFPYTTKRALFCSEECRNYARNHKYRNKKTEGELE